MMKFRAFQNVGNKGSVPIISFRNMGAVLLFLFLFPYIITGMFGNVGVDGKLEQELSEGRHYVENRTRNGVERIPLEIYVADKLSRTMPEEYEEEALKAQAVLIRTGVMEQYEKNVDGHYVMNDEAYGQKEIAPAFREAAAATQGVCVVYEGKYIKASYFAVSNGATRKSTEVLESEEYSYLNSVTCGRDFLAPDYMSRVTFGRSEFMALWCRASGEEADESMTMDEFRLTRDSAGYVIRVDRKESLSGEEFRSVYGLSSSSFSLTEEGNKIIFSVKGVGHGIGMSQFAANEMAKNHEDYIEILNYFFEGTELTKIE